MLEGVNEEKVELSNFEKLVKNRKNKKIDLINLLNKSKSPREVTIAKNVLLDLNYVINMLSEIEKDIADEKES